MKELILVDMQLDYVHKKCLTTYFLVLVWQFRVMNKLIKKNGLKFAYTQYVAAGFALLNAKWHKAAKRMTIEILTNECTLNAVVKKQIWIIKGIEKKLG